MIGSIYLFRDTNKMTDTKKIVDTETVGLKGHVLSVGEKKKFLPSKTDKMMELFKSTDGKVNDEEVFTVEQIREIIKTHFKSEYAKSLTAKKIIPFGKYKGRNVSDVAGFDKDYLRWLYRQSYVQKYTGLSSELSKLFS